MLYSPWPIVLDRPRCGFWKLRISSPFINFLCAAGRWIPVWHRARASGRLRGRRFETDVSCADYTCGASVMCRREGMMCGSSQKHTEAIPSVLHGLVQITSWSFTRILITSTSSFLPRSRAASVGHPWMFIFITKDKSTWWVHSSAQTPTPPLPRQAVVFSPHKACQTGWMEERLQQASKPAALANYGPDVLRNPGIGAGRSISCWILGVGLTGFGCAWTVRNVLQKFESLQYWYWKYWCVKTNPLWLYGYYLTHTSSSCWFTSHWLQEVEKKKSSIVLKTSINWQRSVRKIRCNKGWIRIIERLQFTVQIGLSP